MSIVSGRDSKLTLSLLKEIYMLEIKENRPGYRTFEYLLILDPHEELRSRILNIKKSFNDTYQIGQPQLGKPRISMVKFQQLEMFEERIVQRLNTVAMGYAPIKVELRDYGSFPSHTIFLKVISREPIRQLVREIKVAQRLMKLNDDHKPHFMEEPFIPIAMKLLPWQYEKAWTVFSNKHFTGRFIADGMMLLKRPPGAKGYQILRRFDFLNMPVATRQGELFA